MSAAAIPVPVEAGTQEARKRAPWQRVAWKAGFAAVYAALLTTLILTSHIYASFMQFFPDQDIPFVPTLFGSSVAFLVALVVTLLTLLPFVSRERELPGLLALAGVVVVITGYAYSTLDWTRLLKEFGFTVPGFPPWTVILLSALPFFLAMGLQFHENGRLLTESFQERGVPAGDVRGVRQANLAAGLETLGLTAAAFLAAALGIWGMSHLMVGGRVSVGGLAAPLLAGGLLALVLAAYLWWPRRNEAAEEAAKAARRDPLGPRR